MAVTGRLPLLLLLGLLPVLVAPSLRTVLAVAAVAAAAVTLDVLLAASVAGLRLSRSGDVRCRLGEPATVDLLVSNPGRRPARGVLRDAWPPSAGAAPPRHALDLPAGRQRLLRTTLHPTRRGDRVPDQVTVRCLGPLGLAGRQGRHRVPWAVRVQPAFASRAFLPERLDRLRRLDGQLATRIRGQGTEFDSLRPYVDGDDVRSVDWRATARRAEVVVRTWRPERDRQLLIVLDTSRSAAGRVGDAPRLDASLDAALLLAALAVRAGDRVDVLAVDRAVRTAVDAVGRDQGLRRLADALAGLEPALLELDGGLLVRESLRRLRRRALVVLLTGLEAPPLQEGLLPSLGALTRRHTVLVASVGDPLVAELATGRGEPAAVYAAAAAAQWRQERTRSTALLRRAGVEVVDAPPAELAPALADTYLALKAAGRL